MKDYRLTLGRHDAISYTVENGVPTIILTLAGEVIRIQPAMPVGAEVLHVVGRLAEAAEAFHIDVIKESQYLARSRHGPIFGPGG